MHVASSQGKFGHEFLEFEFRPDGKVCVKCGQIPHHCHPLQMRYANNSNYKNDTIIKKECFVTDAVLQELKRIIEDSEVGL